MCRTVLYLCSVFVFLFCLVCINIGSYNMNINMTGAAIVDNLSGNVQCKAGEDGCIIQCTTFNGSSNCFEAEVYDFPFKVEYIIKQSK